MELGWALISLMVGGAVGWVSIFLFFRELAKIDGRKKRLLALWLSLAILGWFGSLIVAAVWVGLFVEQFVP